MSILSAIDTLTDQHGLSFQSIECSVNGTIITGIEELSYRQGLDPGKQRGTASQVKRRTRGTYDASGSMSMWKDDYTSLIASLAAQGAATGKGYGEVSFVITAIYSEGTTNIVDRLKGVRITSDEDSHSSGSDGLTVNVDLDIMEIDRNGAKMVGPSSISGAIVGAISALVP